MRGRQVVMFVAIVVGLVASIVASLVAGVEGCTSPTDDCVRAMVARLRTPAWLGVETERLDGGSSPSRPWSRAAPRETAGFVVGDVLMTLDGVDLTGTGSADELAEGHARLRQGAVVTFTVARAGATVTLSARLTAPSRETRSPAWWASTSSPSTPGSPCRSGRALQPTVPTKGAIEP